MSLFITLLYLFIIPYLIIMLIIVTGLLRLRHAPPPSRPRSDRLPSVSVIIPAHNEAHGLEPALRSLAQQQYDGPLEFIIVNDRSTDDTADIIERFVQQDARFRTVHLTWSSRRLAPKVNAVNEGIEVASGEIILTSDADCRFPSGWVRGMVAYFEADVVMVTGYVESTRAEQRAPLLHRFESTDWLSLMLANRSFAHFGWAFASSANNQAYRRSAFDAIGGFGSSGRAPSGDEDLLMQRMGRLSGKRVVYADAPDIRVLTLPMPTVRALLNQRRRWASRYRHLMHYHPVFLAGIFSLGSGSIFLTAAYLLLPWFPALVPYVLPLAVIKLGIEFWGMHLATQQLQRRDLWGLPVILWVVLHPAFIGTVVLWALFRSGEWDAGANAYRRRYLQRQWRAWRRKLRRISPG
jgi:cellulose synthase/poly-beta-1,6-N-acetylglucosamine synthase-like glycosyltransferase